MTRTEEAKVKANTILMQIAPTTRMACGFRDVCYSVGDDYDVRLIAKVGRANRRLEIILELNDTYTVRLYHVPTRRAKDQTPKTLAEFKDVYCEWLDTIVYRAVNN